jgi:iron complex transport system permease protein
MSWRINLVAILALGSVTTLALGTGPLYLPPGDVALALAGWVLGWRDVDAQAVAIVAVLRLPRVLLAGTVGAVLGLAGAIMQGLFRNPLADPGVLGVSNGAAFGAALAIFVGHAGGAMLPLAAFVCALVAAFGVERLASTGGRTPVATLILAGIAANALAGAATGIVIYSSDDRQLRDITFWILGSLGGATWERLALVAPPALAVLCLSPLLARGLDALILGEREAGHLGIGVERMKRLAVIGVAASVGAAVSVAGPIGFVGLVVPHLVRLVAGPLHRFVLPLSAAGGAALLIAADTLARVALAPAEMPVGLVTAAIGAPFFAAMIWRERRRLAA